MVKYICEKCGKEFTKSRYTKHINKKKSCIISIENVINENVINENPITYNITTQDYTIINSCCINGLMDMKNNNRKVHLTITSPPYYNVKNYVLYQDYNGYLDTLKRIFSLVY